MNKNLIIQARRASIEEYLRNIGEILLKEGRQYRVKNQSGLVVSGNKWYNHTLLRGGNTLDYLIEVEGMEFKKAVEVLLHGSIASLKPEKITRDGQVVVPERNTNDKRVMAYLIKTRSVNAKVIIPLLKEGRIYEAAGTHNAVFTGADDNNKIRYVMQRSTLPECNLKFESKGSDKRFSFCLKGKSDIIYIFESPIDLLSYVSIQNDIMKISPHMLSLGGVSDIALEAYIERFPSIHRIVFCLDRDKAGNEAYALLYNKYSKRGFNIYRHLPEQKDWNQDLLRHIRCKV